MSVSTVFSGLVIERIYHGSYPIVMVKAPSLNPPNTSNKP